VNTEDDTATKKHEEGKTTFTLKMAKYLSTSGIGDYLDGINVLLSFLLTILHLIDCAFWNQGGTQDVGESQAFITVNSKYYSRYQNSFVTYTSCWTSA
jgi:potassium large conductance calcium-activated channel subfamily M alpha protein 1